MIRPHSDKAVYDTYHSQLACRTFCFRTFPFTFSRLKLSSGLGTMRYKTLFSSTREEEKEEEGRKGRNTREQEREGKKKGKEQKKGFIKTTKDKMSRREKKRQKWIKTEIFFFYIERDGTDEQNQPTTHTEHHVYTLFIRTHHC